MRRPTRNAGKPAKRPRRKSAAGRRSSRAQSTATRGLTARFATLERELADSLEQQAATSEILGIIADSRGELKPVFDAILSNALHICEAKFGNLQLVEDGFTRIAAHTHAPRAFIKLFGKEPIHPGPHTAIGRAIETKKPVHIADIRADRAYAERDRFRMATVNILKARTLLTVPMLKEGKVIGAIAVYRHE